MIDTVTRLILEGMIELTTGSGTSDTKDFLSKLLRDPTEAAAYLNATFEETDQSLTLLALRDIVDAFGFTQVADAAELSRENLYRMLSAEGNPRLSSLFSLFNAIGLRLAVEPDQAVNFDVSASREKAE